MIIHPDNQIFMLLPSSESAQNLNISIKDLLWFITGISLILYFKTRLLFIHLLIILLHKRACILIYLHFVF